MHMPSIVQCLRDLGDNDTTHPIYYPSDADGLCGYEDCGMYLFNKPVEDKNGQILVANTLPHSSAIWKG